MTQSLVAPVVNCYFGLVDPRVSVSVRERPDRGSVSRFVSMSRLPLVICARKDTSVAGFLLVQGDWRTEVDGCPNNAASPITRIHSVSAWF
jgi:hypothetical protein